MIETSVSKQPSSWADNDKLSSQHSNGSNGTNGHLNGHTNGNLVNGRCIEQVPADFMAGKSVRTVYGLVPLKYALDWPVFASYDELAACAAWMGGRIPTAEEAQSIYSYVDYLKRNRFEDKLGKTLPAVNAYVFLRSRTLDNLSVAYMIVPTYNRILTELPLN